MPSNLESRYSIEILDPSGAVIAEFTGRAKDRKLHFVRNGTYEAEWNLDIDSLEQYARAIQVNARSILAVGQNQVRIKRLGVTLFTGQLIYLEGELGEEKNINIKAVGWFELFANRFTSISQTFTGQDAGAIAWQLIDYSQDLANGSYGITQGTIQASRTIAEILYENKSIKDAIVQLSESDEGFDFEITPEKVFNVFYPKMGVTRTEFEFLFPGNIKELSISTDASQLVNYVLARGQGFGEGLIYDVRQDAASQAAYKLRQAISDYSEIPDVTFLQALADEEIRTLKDPLEILQVQLDGNQTPFIGSYWLGDMVNVRVQGLKLYEHINDLYRIDEIEITIDDEDNEVIDLKMMK